MNPLHFVITAGPTLEPIDPVRVITNRSTGSMGYEIAKEAVRRKYRVTLISGPVHLEPPEKVKVINVETAGEMKKAVTEAVKNADCLIMAAAVADFRVEKARDRKIKKQSRLTLKLIQNPDILGSIKQIKLKAKVGFALESGEAVKNAAQKMKNKALDMIVANTITGDNDPFGQGKKDFLIMMKSGERFFLKDADKKQAARAILDTLKKCVL